MHNEIAKLKSITIKNFTREGFQYREWMVENHLEIVERIAMELCDLYPEADRNVVEVLVWFHDFGKPIDEKNEKETTLREGMATLVECGFQKEFIDKVVRYWELMEKKNEIDIRTTPIETQIISSADGAAHFVGVFYPTYFGDGDDFVTTQKHLREKIEKDWERKMVLPEIRAAFRTRYERAKELFGEFPGAFLQEH